MGWQRAAAATGAYVSATLFTLPLDVVKTRMQAAGSRSAWRVAASIMRTEGTFGLFAGLWPAMLMAPGAVLQYSMMDPLRTVMGAVPASCVAAIVDITVKCPFELVRTQLQGGLSGSSATRAIIANTIASRGFAGLWSGYGATLARDIPYTVAKWVSYEYFLEMLGFKSGRVCGWTAPRPLWEAPWQAP